MKKINIFVLFFLGLHLIILFILQFTAWPEMVSFPYLINHGFILYKDAIHAYPPLLVDMLSILYKVFGYKLIVLKVFGWSTILISDVFLFLILRRLIKKVELSLLGLFTYVVLQPILEGNMVWPDLFIVPFLLLTFLLLLKKKYFWSGIVIGLALLTKQTGIFYLGVIGMWLVAFERQNLKNILNYIFGVLVSLIPFAIYLIKEKNFNDFLNWTIIYPSKYWTRFPGYVQLSPTLRQNLTLFLLIFPLTFIVFWSKNRIFRDKMFLILFGFFVCGIVGIYPRFSFFHFQSALAFLLIFYLYLFRNVEKKFLYFLAIIPFFIILINFRSLQFGEARFWSKSDLNLAKIIQNDSDSDKPVYLLGVNSNLYTLSERLPSKPWLDNFGWYLEINGVQERVVESFGKDKPSTVFWQTPTIGSWYDIGTYQPKVITDYIMNNYIKIKEIQKGIWEWQSK